MRTWHKRRPGMLGVPAAALALLAVWSTGPPAGAISGGVFGKHNWAARVFMGDHGGSDPSRARRWTRWRVAGRAAGESRPSSRRTGEQHLTPEGVELFRSEVLGTGPFDHDLSLVGERLSHWGTVEVRSGDRLVCVTLANPFFEPPKGATTATPAQVGAMRRLGVLFTHPAPSWSRTTRGPTSGCAPACRRRTRSATRAGPS